MNRLLLMLTASLMLHTGTNLPASGEELPLTPEEQLAGLAWLEGDWRSEESEMSYTGPTGGMILAFGKVYMGESRSAYGKFEQFSIRDGVVTLTPFPGCRQSDSYFPLVMSDPANRRAEFENLKHDWPTHFLYECPDENTLHLVMSGPRADGSISTWEFTLVRVGSAPAAAAPE